jgi:hypothetical protein
MNWKSIPKRFKIKQLTESIKLWLDTQTGINPYGLIFKREYNPSTIVGITADGKWFMFRAKGNWIRFVVCDKEEDFRGYVTPEEPYLFERYLDYGSNVDDASWIPHTDAIMLCTLWLNEYYGVTSCRTKDRCKQFKASKRAMKRLEDMAKNMQYRRIQFEKDA